MSGRPDVAIVGGGAIGCAIAFELARRGASVVVVERDRVGAEASSAAAGMLAPLAELFGPAAPGDTGARRAFLELAIASLRRFPALVAAIREVGGIDPCLVDAGMLRILDAPPSPEQQQRLLDLAGQYGLRLEVVEGARLSELQPGIDGACRWGLLSLDEHQLDAPAYVQALAGAARAYGATVSEGTPIIGIRTEGDRIVGLRTADGEIQAGQFVFAMGAWSNAIGQWLGLSVPVQPVRGQILSVRSATRLPRTVYGPRSYLVPKRNGTIVVGATEEPAAGYEKRVTVRGLASVLDAAAALLPAIGEAEIVATWSGLRPGTPDHLPILGRAGDWANGFLATGHFRNGILMSAITSEVMADLLLGASPAVDLTAFSSHRFAAVSVG